MEQVGFEKLNQWKYSCNKVCSNQRSENAAKIEVSGRLSALLFCTAFQLIYSCDFFLLRFASEEIDVRETAVFLYGRAMQLFPRMLRRTVHTQTFWIYVAFPDAGESTGLNDEPAASATLPIKKLIVCPSRKGNDPLGFGLHISLVGVQQPLLTVSSCR